MEMEAVIGDGTVQVLLLGVLKVRAKWPATNWPTNQTDPSRTEPL